MTEPDEALSRLVAAVRQDRVRNRDRVRRERGPVHPTQAADRVDLICPRCGAVSHA